MVSLVRIPLLWRTTVTFLNEEEFQKREVPKPMREIMVGVTVRRERRWTSAGETPARELVRSTRKLCRGSG
jgi:hypothetical protein